MRRACCRRSDPGPRRTPDGFSAAPAVLRSSSPCVLALAVAADEVVRGAVVPKRRFGPALELRDDALGELLAQLDSPLIEGVDVPDDALGEDAVFVEGDQLAERLGSEAIGHDRVRGTVALEDPMRNDGVGGALGLDLLARLAEGERLALREDVGEQYVVVPAERVQR